MVHISGIGMEGKNSMFAKYNRDTTREQITVAKQAGARCALELMLFSPRNEDGTVYGPIGGTRFDGAKMKEMTKEAMEIIIQSCASDARKAMDFGFDLVTFHFGHDSLCSQFLSPFFNTRKDEYGGSLENRIRFRRDGLLL